jgi:hypothetical protein
VPQAVAVAVVQLVALERVVDHIVQRSATVEEAVLEVVVVEEAA